MRARYRPSSASRATIPASRKSEMKSRHAGALALVGWYLMAPVPPARDRGYWGRLHDLIFGASEHAPMSQWNQRGVFDTAEKCDAAETKEENAALESFGQTPEEKGKSKG